MAYPPAQKRNSKDFKWDGAVRDEGTKPPQVLQGEIQQGLGINYKHPYGLPEELPLFAKWGTGVESLGLRGSLCSPTAQQ